MLLSCSGFAQKQQVQKAKGDQPSSSHSYEFIHTGDSINPYPYDSLLSGITTYKYDANGHAIAEVTTAAGTTDSLVREYNSANRITECRQFTNGILMQSQKWDYDETHALITYYELMRTTGSNMDSVVCIVYHGVHDFNNVESFRVLEALWDLPLEIRDCDSASMYYYSENKWIGVLTIYPKYTSGKVSTVSLVLLSLDAIDMGAGLSISGIKIDFTFSYSPNGVLSKIKGSIIATIPGLPIPISLTDAFLSEYQYKDNGEVKEIVHTMKLQYAPLLDVYVAVQESYTYNSNDAVSLITTYQTEDGVTWILSAKKWFFYDGVSIAAITEKTTWQIYPNPVQDKFRIDNLQEEVYVSIHDMAGRIIIQQQANRDNAIIYTATIPSGIYIVKIEGKASVKTAKLIIQ